MANTGYIINPKVVQIFTTGPNSGSEVNPTFNFEFLPSSSITQSFICGNEYNYKTIDYIQCPPSGVCISPSITELYPVNCNPGDYEYFIEFTTFEDIIIDNPLIDTSTLQYSLQPNFTGEIGSQLVINSGSINSLIVDISDGLSILPINKTIPVYFRISNSCDYGDFFQTSSFSIPVSTNC